MSEPNNRRQFLRRFLGWLAGSAAAVPAAVSAASQNSGASPPRCPHYIEGTFWRHSGPAAFSYPIVDTKGCPYCRNLARSGSEYISIFTYDCDTSLRLAEVSGHVTTYTFDRNIPPTANPSCITTMIYEAVSRHPIS
jgi:hypothetical protein